MGFKELCPSVPQNLLQDTRCSGFFASHKIYHSSVCECFDLSKVVENISSSRTAINQPLTGKNGREMRSLVIVESGPISQLVVWHPGPVITIATPNRNDKVLKNHSYFLNFFVFDSVI
jgi:hypothetical protein